MGLKRHLTGVAKHLSSFADAVEVGPNMRLLFTSGTPGLLEDGSLPAGIEAQTTQAWTNVAAALSVAEMGLEDIVKVTTTLKHAEDIPAYQAARDAFFGNAPKPAAHLLTGDLVRPEILVEVEVVAAKDH
jgi:2-iminobutanoate/2-iminopropanoate deaminase